MDIISFFSMPMKLIYWAKMYKLYEKSGSFIRRC